MRLKPTNPFFRITPIEEGFSADEAKVSGYNIPDMIKKGYRYIPEGDRYVRNRSEFLIKPLGVIALGLIGITMIEAIKLLK